MIFDIDYEPGLVERATATLAANATPVEVRPSNEDVTLRLGTSAFYHRLTAREARALADMLHQIADQVDPPVDPVQWYYYEGEL